MLNVLPFISFIFLHNHGVQPILHAPQPIPWSPESNDQINPPMALRLPFMRCLFSIFLFECMIRVFLNQSYVVYLFPPNTPSVSFYGIENDNYIIEDTEIHFNL